MVSKLSSDELLLTATANLKKGIEYAVHQIRSKRVNPETKLRWMCNLTRQVEALVKVTEALNKIGSKSAVDIDLASYLSGLETRVPRKFATKKFVRIVEKTSLSGSRHAHRRT